MPNPYPHGTVNVGVTAALLVTVAAENAGVLIQNQGPGIVYIGGPSVTADATATGGFKIASSASQLIPSVGGKLEDLYAVASAASSVTWLQPGATDTVTGQ
jgi:hypothetical protein